MKEFTIEYKLQSISDFIEKNGIKELSIKTIDTIFNDINSLEESLYLYDILLYSKDMELNLSDDEIERACKWLDKRYDCNLSHNDNIEIAVENL